MLQREFFTSPCGSEIVVKDKHGYRDLQEDDHLIIKQVYEFIKEKCPEAIVRLNELYSHNANYKWLSVKRFVKCNWGIKDEKTDLSENSYNFELVHCPLRGECFDEEIICQPKINSGLSKRELEIVQLIANGLTDKQIAYQLVISPRTAENHRKNILDKLGLHNKAEIVDFAHKNNLIQ